MPAYDPRIGERPMLPDKTKEVIRQAHLDWTKAVIIQTLEFLRDTYTGTGPSIDDLERCIKDVCNACLDDGCCELCAEVRCDSDCPLRGFRDADK